MKKRINPELKKLDLTIIIPTFERQSVIKNLAEFYNKKPYEVLILDGSKSSIDFTFPSNVNYIWSGDTYLERLKSSRKFIKTNYVCMIGDDEFHFLEAIEECINFLDVNKNYSSCSGFPVSHHNAYFKGLKESTGFDSFFSSKLTKSKYIFDNNCYSNLSISRLKDHFCDYKPRFIYSITRKKIWDAAIYSMAIAAEELSALGLYELMIEYSIIGAGPVNLINIPMWYRSYLFENLDSADSPDLCLSKKSPLFHDFWPNLTKNRKKKLINKLHREIPIIDFENFDNTLNIYSKKVIQQKNSQKSRFFIRHLKLSNYFFRIHKFLFARLIFVSFKYRKKIAIFLLTSGLKISANSKRELRNYLVLITKNLFFK